MLSILWLISHVTGKVNAKLLCGGPVRFQAEHGEFTLVHNSDLLNPFFIPEGKKKILLLLPSSEWRGKIGEGRAVDTRVAHCHWSFVRVTPNGNKRKGGGNTSVLNLAHTPLVLTITGLESRLAQSRPSAPSHMRWFLSSRTVDIPH